MNFNMNSLAGKLTMIKINQALKMAQEGKSQELLNNLSHAEKEKIRMFLQNMDPEQLNMISQKVKEIAANMNAEQLADITARLNEFNPALAHKLEDILK